jgi:hypothetical protein
MLSSAISIVRSWLIDRPVQIFITCAGGPTVSSDIGPTLLEISRSNRVPHLSICGGLAIDPSRLHFGRSAGSDCVLFWPQDASHRHRTFGSNLTG